MASEYDHEPARYDDEPRFDRQRSASPRDDYRGDRARSRSPNVRMDDRPPVDIRKPIDDEDEEGALNPGSNLFVTGINPRLTESDLSRLFEKYGDVENCSIMVDPHSKESRGFGFVNMVTGEQADAAKEGLQGEVIEGRTLSIEKARRSRPRTPTPGKYFGPPKRGESGGRGGGGPRGPRGDRFDDRRGPSGGGWRRPDDRYGRYDSYSDRSRDYGREPREPRDGGRDGRDYRDYRRDYRDDYGSRGIDRYASSRDDRYSRDDRRDDRRGGYYDRDANPPSYGGGPPTRDAYSSRSFTEDRYAGR